MPQKRRRVLLKLSGEAFGRRPGRQPDVVSSIAKEIAAAAPADEDDPAASRSPSSSAAATSSAARSFSQRGMDRGRADYMGMLGTVMNSLALQDFLEQAAPRRACSRRSR